VAFEEGARTKDWVIAWHQTRDFDRLADYRKRVLVCVERPVAPMERSFERHDVWAWKRLPVFYYGTQVKMVASLTGVLEGKVRVIWDIDPTPETPNPFPFEDILGNDPSLNDYRAFVNDLYRMFDHRTMLMTGKLKGWWDEWSERGDPVANRQIYSEARMTALWAFVRDCVEWRSVLVVNHYQTGTLWEIDGERRRRIPDPLLPGTPETNINIGDWEVSFPVMFLADFHKKAKTPAMKDMPAIEMVGVSEEFRRRRMRFLEEFRDGRDELKQSLLARVLNPERANRMAEKFGLSLDEYLERV